MATASEPITRDGLRDELNEFGLKLFAYLDKRFDEVNRRIDAIEIDNHARDAQIARLERWIETIAQKTGVRLEY